MARFALRPPVVKERDVTRACIDILKLHGYRPFRLQSGLFKTPDNRWILVGEPGLPDFICLHPSKPGFLLEVKRPGEKPTLDQIRMHGELHLWGLVVVVAQSVGDLSEALKEQGF